MQDESRARQPEKEAPAACIPTLIVFRKPYPFVSHGFNPSPARDGLPKQICIIYNAEAGIGDQWHPLARPLGLSIVF
jgi:hypothetical protein